VVNINDQVLGATAESLGQSGQVDSGDLVEDIQPQIDVDKYRAIYELLTVSNSTSGGAGAVVVTFVPGKLKSWRISAGVMIINGMSGDLSADIVVRDQFGTFIRAGMINIKDDETRNLVNGVPGDFLLGLPGEFVPNEIFVPSGGHLRLDIKEKGGGIIGVASITVRFVARLEPPVRRFDVFVPTTEFYP